MTSLNWFRHRKTLGSIVAIAICTLLLIGTATLPVGANFGTSDPTITSHDGHDRAYTTTNRPGNMSVGMIGFNLTTGRVEVANGSTLNNITDVADSTVAATAGGANTLIAGAGGPATGTTAGANGGNVNVQSGAGGSNTATANAAGGAAGAVNITGAAGGNTASTGSASAGNGATVTISSGAGGNATAGTGNGGNAGSIVLAPAAGGTTAGGTAGTIGHIQLGGPVASPVTAAQTIATSGTITLPTSGRNKLLTTSAAVTAAVVTAGLFDGQEVILINTSANSITMAASGTSHVADGTSCVIAANTKLTFVWSATQSLWYH